VAGRQISGLSQPSEALVIRVILPSRETVKSMLNLAEITMGITGLWEGAIG
jgi:hypothetical protein